MESNEARFGEKVRDTNAKSQSPSRISLKIGGGGGFEGRSLYGKGTKERRNERDRERVRGLLWVPDNADSPDWAAGTACATLPRCLCCHVTLQNSARNRELPSPLCPLLPALSCPVRLLESLLLSSPPFAPPVSASFLPSCAFGSPQCLALLPIRFSRFLFDSPAAHLVRSQGIG